MLIIPRIDHLKVSHVAAGFHSSQAEHIGPHHFFFKTSKPDFCLTEMKTCNLPGVFHLLLQNLSVKACVCSLIKCRWSSGCVLRAVLPNCSPWSGFPSPWTLGGFLCLWAKSVNSVICVWPKRWVYMSAGHNEGKKRLYIIYTMGVIVFWLNHVNQYSKHNCSNTACELDVNAALCSVFMR